MTLMLMICGVIQSTLVVILKGVGRLNSFGRYTLDINVDSPIMSEIFRFFDVSQLLNSVGSTVHFLTLFYLFA